MTLDVILDKVFTKGDVADTIRIAYGTTLEPADFLWGIEYTRQILSFDNLQARAYFSQKREIELVYEGNSGKLYLVKPKSIDDVKAECIVSGGEERRWRIFGSVELYKAFFELLNNRRSSGSVSDREYISIILLLQKITNEAFSKRTRYFWDKLFGWEMILKYLHAKKETNATLVRYLDEANASLTSA